MAIYNVLVPMPGDKELKFEKGMAPSLWPGVGNILIPADTKVIPVSKPFELDDALHQVLHKPKQFSTYLLCRVGLPEGVPPDSDEALEDALGLIDLANYAEVVESVFSYQIIKLEFYDVD